MPLLKSPPTLAKRAAPSATVFDGILQAIARQRLTPGMKLNEESLGAAFGVSRTKVRAALLQLSGRGLVSMQTKRTARIATPSVKQAQDVFALRKLVEPVIAADVARISTPAMIRELRRLHKDEHLARSSGDRIEATRLAGEFHVALARRGTNELMLEIVQRTVDQSFLITVLYQAPGSPACVRDEHEAIIAALQDRDANRAAKAMKDHIVGIEGRMLLEDPAVAPELDIRSVFDGIIG